MMQPLRLPANWPLTQLIARPMSRDKADTLLLLVSCLLVLAPHAGHMPAWITLICSTVLLWRGWLTFRGNRMPPRWLLLPIACLALVAVYASYKTFFGRDAGVSMLVLLLTFKLLEMHAKRDLFVVIFVNFFLILANFFYSQSIGTASMMIAAVIAILTTQLSFQYTGVVPPFKQRLALGASIFAMALPLTLVLFILFPRIQGPLWGLPSDANAGRSGMSDSMAPGNISNLALSDDIAFRVSFVDPAPVRSKLYWRGVVLGNYDGRTWTQLSARRAQSRQTVIRPHNTNPIRYQVTLEPSGRNWLFALELPRAAPQIPGNRAGFSADVQLLAEQAINERVRYDVASFVDFDLQPDASSALLEAWLELPSGFNPKTLAFAQRLRKQATDNTQAVNAVLTFFRQEPFRYTLEPPPLGQHAVDEFLFSTRAGFCEHYAGAFVVLMRALGIPARVVTGYQGGEVNPVDGFMTVRQSDAHAWTEVWLENRGWVRVDPTAAVAPGRVEFNLASVIPRRLFGGLIKLDIGKNSWLAALRVNWDAVNNAWNQWVLNYTPEKQKSFIQSLGFNDVDWRTLVALMLVFGGAAMLIVILPLVTTRRKVDPVTAAYATLCRHMARHGCARALDEGPRSYAERLNAATSPLADDKKIAVTRFLQLYESLQYGAPTRQPSAAAISQLKSLLTECR